MPENRDYWWNVSSATVAEDLGQSVATAIREYGLPFLDEHAALQRVREILVANETILNHDSNSHIDLAILQAYSGSLTDAQTELEKQLEIARSAHNRLYEENLLGVLQRLTKDAR